MLEVPSTENLVPGGLFRWQWSPAQITKRLGPCGGWPLSKILEKIVSNLLQVAKIDSDNTIPFAVRFKLVPDSEKFKP